MCGSDYFLYLCVCEVFRQLLIGSNQTLILLFELCLLSISSEDSMKMCIKVVREKKQKPTGLNNTHVNDYERLTPSEL